MLIAGAFAIGAAGVVAGGAISGDDSPSAPTTTVVSTDATPAEVTEAQTSLNAVGCYPFPADGEYGPHTASAVAAFQAASGLPDDVGLDAATIEALEAAAAAGSTVCTEG